MKKQAFFLIQLLLVLSFSCSSSDQSMKDDPNEKEKIEIRSFRLQVENENPNITDVEIFYLASNDFDEKMTWNEALDLVREVGDNWRLPTKEEFEKIVSQTPTIEANMTLYKGGYWTSSQYSSQQGDYAWQSSFEFGFPSEYYSKNNYAYVLLLKK
jgi:hypothetical protein